MMAHVCELSPSHNLGYQNLDPFARFALVNFIKVKISEYAI